MISSLKIAAFIVNIVIAAAIIVLFVVRNRKTKGFGQSLLWGILAGMLSNVIVNLIGTTLFPSGLTGMNFILASLFNSVLMTAGIVIAYSVSLNFQFKKGDQDKAPAINAFGFSVIAIFNTIMQSINFILYSFAINAGTVEQFLTEQFTQENLDALIKSLQDSSVLLFLELGLTRIFELTMLVIVFTLIYKSYKSLGSIKLKGILVPLLIVFTYYMVNTMTIYIANNMVLVYLIRFIYMGALVFFFKHEVEL